MAEYFPTLLVATEFAPNASGGGPAVVRQILKGWPADRLLWWSCLPEIDGRFGQQVGAHSVAAIPPKLYPHRRACLQKSWILENVWAPWAARHFTQSLKRFNPDCIWVIPHVWSIPPLSRVLPESAIGFHVSIHDFADLNGAFQRFGEARARRMAAGADRLYQFSASRDAISQPMLDDLELRTGKTGVIARAGLEQDALNRIGSGTGQPCETIKIAYAGTIIVEETFALFISALSRIRPRLPRPVTIEFFGDHSYRTRPWFDLSWMREHGNLATEPLTAALRQCTWGFAPMSLQDDDPRYNRFSLPTKLASYLAAGLPVITLGHPESCIVRLARGYDLGVNYMQLDLEGLSHQLLGALSKVDPRSEYAPEILRCARAEFDSEQMRRRFQDSLRACAAASKVAHSRDSIEDQNRTL